MDTEFMGRRADLHERFRAVQLQLEGERVRLHALLEQCRSTARLGRTVERSPRSAPVTRLFATDEVRLGDVEVIVPRQTIRDGRSSRRLTPTEWQLLLFLLTNPDTVHTRSELAAGAWGTGYDGRDTEVEVYVSRLRRKLGSAAPLLETVRGRGYRFILWGDGAGEDTHPAA